MFDVIEHIPNLKTYLKEIHRILKPDGYLIFQTPNKYINISWNIIRGQKLKYINKYHCSLQTIWALRRNLQNAGFKNIVIQKFSINTEHNRVKVRQVMGGLGFILLRIFEEFPLDTTPDM